MAPGNHESAGKRLRGTTTDGNRWVKRVLCQLAWAAGKDTYYASQFRRLAARRGKKRAVVAVGHSILVAVYHMLQSQSSNQDLSADYFEKLPANHFRRYLVRKLQQQGYHVILEKAPSSAR